MSEYDLYFASCVKSGGIYHYILKNEEFTFVEKISCDRPMFLDVTTDRLLALLRSPFRDNNYSGIYEFQRCQDGSIGRLIHTECSKGIVSCHLCRYKGNVYTANYLSGSVYCSSGKLHFHEGRGADPQRQDSAHVHFIAPAPDGSCLLAVDLGLDTIFSYDRDLNIISKAQVPTGSGARHLAYSEDGKFVFCVNELASTVTVFRYSNNTLDPIETVSVFNKPVSGNISAAIRVLGEYVYVSNRGDDSISCLKWGNEQLKLCSVIPCGGVYPRDFILINHLLICMNEKSNNVTIFEVNESKLLKTEMMLTIPCPICAVFLER